jgi:hypothetical protein
LNKNLSKEILNTVKKKTGKVISENAVKKLASGVTSETIKDEAELRKLIKQVSAMANVPVSENTVKEIIKAVKASGMNMNNIESLMKTMLSK